MSDREKPGLPGVAGPMYVIGDKRIRTRIIDGEQCIFVAGTHGCSGCNMGPLHEPGMGCSECGHTGKRRHRMWLPVSVNLKRGES